MQLMTVEEVVHYDKNRNILWRAENLTNLLHAQGQEFILKSVFVGASGVTIPSSYYIGLDNRSSISKADILESLVGEPTQFGYHRQTVSSQTGFGATFDSVNWKVITATLVFSAVGGSWGPVKNAFLSTSSMTMGFLISTVPLPTTKTVNNGESFSFKISLSLLGD